MGCKKMSTIRFWGKPDDGVKIRHAEGGFFYVMGVKILAKWRGSTKTAICKPSDGVK